MEFDTLFQAIFLGVVEGITEFLPISSTGHLILLIDLLSFEGPEGKSFEVIIQLGAILAICWLYRQRLWSMATGLHKDHQERHFCTLLLVGFLPAAIIGATLHSYIKTVLFSPEIVAIMLIIGGIAIWLIERYKPAPRIHQLETITIRKALAIGCFQALAVIPGTSRSGSTIMGGLLLGLERKLAAEFSFFLAIPTMLGATVYDIYKNYHVMSLDDIELIAAGFVTAFIVALLTVRWLLAVIGQMGFIPFAIYRILLGSLMLYLMWF